MILTRLFSTVVQATYGGGAHIRNGGNLALKSCTMLRNAASPLSSYSGTGGAINAENGVTLVIVSSTFASNYAVSVPPRKHWWESEFLFVAVAATFACRTLIMFARARLCVDLSVALFSFNRVTQPGL